MTPRFLHGTVFVLLAALAGCGKVGSPDVPQGSVFPRVYPSDALHPATETAKPLPTGPSPTFTPSGAWIDPDQRLPSIDPYADVLRSAPTAIAGPTSPAVGASGAASPTYPQAPAP